MKSKKIHFHIQQSRIELSPENTWKLVSNPNTLARLNPPWLAIQIISGSRQIDENAEFEFRVLKGFLKGQWKIRVTMIRKGFVIGFEILSPQNRVWILWTKVLPGDGAQNCILEDRVEFPVARFPGVKPRAYERVIKEMIYYRHHTLKTDIAALGLPESSAKQKILVAGGSGLVGTGFTRLARMRGHEVRLLSTRENVDHIYWNPEKGMIQSDALEGYDTVINLAGYPIACRWNKRNRQRILDSRLKSSHLLIKTLTRLNKPPRNYLQASATGYYGFNNLEKIGEQSNQGTGFLAEVCASWEKETHILTSTSIRNKIIRLGIVLSPQGGALAKMLPIFKLGLGGRLGNGKQYFPWISIDDLSRLLVFLVENEHLQGTTFNACVPEPCTNQEFTLALGKALSRPAVFPVPSILLKLLYGKMAKEALLGGMGAQPLTILNSGFQFYGENLVDSLKLMMGKS